MLVATFRAAQKKGAYLRKLRVVLAEDNPAFLEHLRSVIGNEFDVVATATDGQSALDTIRRVKPDVVVIDLAMPVLNGIEVTKKLATSSWHPPVVICSVESDPEIVEAAKMAGASAYVYKVRIEDDLILAVKAVWGGKSFVSTLPS
jgi:DNA-binding NarL/FixJ family response regulator